MESVMFTTASDIVGPPSSSRRASYASVLKGTLTTNTPNQAEHRPYIALARRSTTPLPLPLPVPIPVPVPRIVFRRRSLAPPPQPQPQPQPQLPPRPQRSALNPRAPPFYPAPASAPEAPRAQTPFNPLAPVFTPWGSISSTPRGSVSSSFTTSAARTNIIPATPWTRAGHHHLLRRSLDASGSTVSARGSDSLPSGSSLFASPWSVAPWGTSPWTTPLSPGATPLSTKGSLVRCALAGREAAGRVLMALLRSGSEPIGEEPMKDFGPIGGPVKRERTVTATAERKRLVNFTKERTARRVQNLRY